MFTAVLLLKSDNMKIKILALLAIVALSSACKLDSDTCPQWGTVQFANVDIPDSVAVGQKMIVDVDIYDYGCYTACDYAYVVKGDTVYLEALAQQDRCDCPNHSQNLSMSFALKFDSTFYGCCVSFLYSKISANGDSLMLGRDSVFVY